LFDAPFRGNRCLFVKLPNDEGNERQVEDRYSLCTVVVVSVDIVVRVDFVALLSFYFIFSFDFFAFAVSLALDRGFELLFEKVHLILLRQPSYLGIDLQSDHSDFRLRIPQSKAKPYKCWLLTYSEKLSFPRSSE
jgi:hypothetical protein